MNKSLTGEEVRSSGVTAPAITIATFYAACIVGAELLSAYVNFVSGIMLHAVLVPLLLTQYAVFPQVPYRRILPVLALVSLLRILSVSMIIRVVPVIYWFILIGVPVLLSIFLATRLLRLGAADIGFRKANPVFQLLVVLTGLPLGVAGYFLVRPEPLLAQFTVGSALLFALILVLFVGLMGELLFRGLLLRVLNETHGTYGLVLSSVLFAAMHIGSQSWGYVALMSLVGLLFGWIFRRTGAIWGVAGAHSLLVIVGLLIMPQMMR